jgi:exonuclease VII small subunit
MIDLEKVRKEYTREEFLEEAKKIFFGKLNDSQSCPNCYDFKMLSGNMLCTCPNAEENCKECWRQAVQDLKFKDDIEGEKMENKKFKVRCISGFNKEITSGKEYLVIGEDEKYYRIDKNDNGFVGLDYHKYRFEKVKEESINYEEKYNDLKFKNELNEKSSLVLKGHIEALEKEKDMLEESNEEYKKALDLCRETIKNGSKQIEKLKQIIKDII